MAEKLNNINTVLKKEGRLQNWLSSKIGLSERSISLYCKNKRQPTIETLFKISAILKVPVCDLLAKENPYAKEQESKEELPDSESSNANNDK